MRPTKWFTFSAKATTMLGISQRFSYEKSMIYSTLSNYLSLYLLLQREF